MQLSGLTALDFFETVDLYNGTEEERLAVDERSDEVLVPECRFGLTDEHLHQLQQEVNPLAESQNY